MRPRISTMAVALAFAALLGISLAETATAQARVEEKASFGVTGEVKAVDVAKRTIDVMGAHDEGVTYAVDPAVTVMAGAEGGKELQDVVVGSSVVMNGHDDGTTKTVTYIKVVKQP